MRKDRVEHDCDCDICRALRDGDTARLAEAMTFLANVPPPRHSREIEDHVARFAGPLRHVMTSDRRDAAGAVVGGVNVLFFGPTPERPYRLLVTAGVSDLPLCPPPGSEYDLAWAEFAVCLPADWPLGSERLDEDRWDWGPSYWPVRLLFELASVAHQGGEWIWYHHTAGFGDRQTLADGLAFNSLMFRSSATMPESFLSLSLPSGKQIHFLSLVPLYPEELEFVSRQGDPQALVDRLDGAGVTDLIVPGRPSCIPRE